jgi:ParB/RepB/Spo0J family partition protein
VTSGFRMVPVGDLVCPPQARKTTGFGVADLAGLAESIKESGGIHLPLLVRNEGGKLVVLDGERRLRAAKLAGLTEVPVVVSDESMSDSQVLHRQLVLDAQRVGLGPMERARALGRLIEEAGWSAEQAARKLGLSAATVSRSLALLKLPEAIQAKVSSGTLPADSAYLLARMDDPQAQAALAAQAGEGMLSRDALSRKLRRVRRAENAAQAGVARATVALGGGRTVTVTGKDITLDSLVDLLEPLLARARKARSQGLSLHTFIRTLKDQASATGE